MADSISIIMKMTEDVTSTLKSIASSSQGCSKEFEALQRKAQQLGTRYADFNKKAASTAGEALSVKKAMQEAAAAFKKSGDEADRVRFESLKEQYDALTAAANGYSKAAKDTIKDIQAIETEARKLTQQTPSLPDDSSGSSFLTSIFGSELSDKLGKAGVFTMLGDAASAFADATIESAIGQPIATMLSSIVSGVATGTAAGALAGIPGIGAAAGGVAGVFTGWSQIYSAKDDAFKSYYQNLYEEANAGTEESISSGKTVAAARETKLLSFTTLLGDEKKAAAFLEDIVTAASETPFDYDTLTGLSKTLLTFGTAVEDIIPTMEKVGDAGAALGLSTTDISTVATYIGRMQSSDKATLEYLNPLNERGFSVFQWIADDLGITIADVYDKISKSELSGTYVSDLILSQFATLYGGQMEKQAQTTEGLDSTLEDLLGNIDAAGGDAYNTLRKEGKAADISAYEGDLGTRMKELSAISGEVQAYGENLAAQYQREAMAAILTGADTTVFDEAEAAKLQEMRMEYLQLRHAYMNGDMEAGVKMVDISEEAEALATAAYESSEWAIKLHEAELDEIEAMRQLTSSLDAATLAWETSNAFSKGQATGNLTEVQNALEGKEADLTPMQMERLGLDEIDGSHAFGLRRVPYDGYRAILHAGESVWTAEETRDNDIIDPNMVSGQMRASSRGDVVLQVHYHGDISVREESDLDAIAERLADNIADRMTAWAG